jgi:fumarate reductase flavoprotein subunit
MPSAQGEEKRMKEHDYRQPRNHERKELEMEMGFDRRSFLKGTLTAGMAAVAGGALLAGCAPTDTGDTGATGGASPSGDTGGATAGEYVPSWMNRPALGEPEETVQADFVVCGAGGCGLSAALQADELGLNVILLEKKSIAGGTFGFSEVTYCPNNYHMAEKMDLSEIISTKLSYVHYVIDQRTLIKFHKLAPQTIEWVEGFGCQFNLEMNFMPVSLFYAGDGSSGSTEGNGFKFIQHFIDEAEKRGIDIRYETPAQELVMEGGKVAGVLAVDSSGKVIKFEAPAVMLATGGWGSNEDMLRELGGVNPDRVTASGFDGRDGDGVIMARKAGAAWARGNDTIMFYGPLLPGVNWGETLQMATTGGTLWVNGKGRRFMREASMQMHQMELGSALRDVDRHLVIYSQSDVDYYTEQGDWMPIPDFPELLQKQIDSGNDRIYVADTIEELADKIGIDKTTFVGEVARYNELVEKGEDEDFLKDASFLRPIKAAPFYAFECNDAFYTTSGGVRTDENILALDEQGDPIVGLYVGGTDTGALCGDIYDFATSPGEQSSWAMNSGRMAAMHVAETLKG